jgi:hypothetical protein
MGCDPDDRLRGDLCFRLFRRSVGSSPQSAGHRGSKHPAPGTTAGPIVAIRPAPDESLQHTMRIARPERRLAARSPVLIFEALARKGQGGPWLLRAFVCQFGAAASAFTTSDHVPRHMARSSGWWWKLAADEPRGSRRSHGMLDIRTHTLPPT